jgi:hypothetical protein
MRFDETCSEWSMYNLFVKIRNNDKYNLWNFFEEVSIIFKIDPQELGDGKNELPMRKLLGAGFQKSVLQRAGASSGYNLDKDTSSYMKMDGNTHTHIQGLCI